MTITMAQLTSQCHVEALKLLQFVKSVRGGPEKNFNLTEKYNHKPAVVAKLFENSLWRNVQAGGHERWKHPVTGIQVGYPGHYGRKQDKVMDPAAVENIAKQLQIHLNILRNEVYLVPWKKEPDIDSAAENLRKMLEKQGPAEEHKE